MTGKRSPRPSVRIECQRAVRYISDDLGGHRVAFLVNVVAQDTKDVRRIVVVQREPHQDEQALLRQCDIQRNSSRISVGS